MMELNKEVMRLRDFLPRSRKPQIVQIRLEDLIDQLIPTPKICLKRDGWIMDIVREKK